MADYEFLDLKPYKGYDVQKAWKVDNDGKRIGKVVYVVSDDEDVIGEEYKSVAEAHRFIDSISK